MNKLDVDTDCLDYEILWEDLTIGEQIGQGSQFYLFIYVQGMVIKFSSRSLNWNHMYISFS